MSELQPNSDGICIPERSIDYYQPVLFSTLVFLQVPALPPTKKSVTLIKVVQKSPYCSIHLLTIVPPWTSTLLVFKTDKSYGNFAFSPHNSSHSTHDIIKTQFYMIVVSCTVHDVPRHPRHTVTVRAVLQRLFLHVHDVLQRPRHPVPVRAVLQRLSTCS